MEWDLVSSAARSLLEAFTRMPGPSAADDVIAAARHNDQTWRSNSEVRKEMFRALSALERAGLIERPDGFSLALTNQGRATAVTPGWRFDPTDKRLVAWAAMEDLADLRLNPVAGVENAFAQLSVEHWRQFGRLDLEFDNRLTVISGANAAGKTTLLNVLGQHFDWSAQFLSVGSESRAANGFELTTRPLGTLRYWNGVRTPIVESIQPERIASSSVMFPEMQQVPGIYISSHRSLSHYRQLQDLPARFSATDALLQQFAFEVQSRYTGTATNASPLYRMKEALVAAAMHGYGNKAVRANPEARVVWEGFQDVLRSFLPKSLGFKGLQVDDGDILISTKSAEFPIEAVSGGISAMLELAWQIFLRGRQSDEFTVCIDEPENHLHPELQRAVIPALLDGFPRARFIVATHSPLVVTSVSGSRTYALRVDAAGTVNSHPVSVNASGTADEALMSVLGLDTPLPIWVERELEEALSQLPANPTAHELRKLRERLLRAGLEQQFPAALRAISAKDDDDPVE